MEKTIQAGTTLQIDEDFHKMVKEAFEDYKITESDLERWNYNFDVEHWPIQIEFNAIRVDRKSVYLAWQYVDPHLAGIQHFDLSLFKKLGFEIIKPDSPEIDIMNAEDKILGTRDLVLKHFILQSSLNGRSRAWCEAVIGRVESAMGEVGAYFYIP